MPLSKPGGQQPDDRKPPTRREGFSDWADLEPDEEKKLDEVWDQLGREGWSKKDTEEPAA